MRHQPSQSESQDRAGRRIVCRAPPKTVAARFVVLEKAVYTQSEQLTAGTGKTGRDWFGSPIRKSWKKTEPGKPSVSPGGRAAELDAKAVNYRWEQFEAVKRWHTDDWLRLQDKLRSSVVEGISVFLSMFDDNPQLKRVFCPPKECYSRK